MLLGTHDRSGRSNAAAIVHIIKNRLACRRDICDRSKSSLPRQTIRGSACCSRETMRSEFEVSGRTMSSSELSFLARHMNSENDSRTCLVPLPASAALPAVRLVNKLRPLYPPPLSRPFLHHPEPTDTHTKTRHTTHTHATATPSVPNTTLPPPPPPTRARPSPCPYSSSPSCASWL